MRIAGIPFVLALAALAISTSSGEGTRHKVEVAPEIGAPVDAHEIAASWVAGRSALSHVFEPAPVDLVIDELTGTEGVLRFEMHADAEDVRVQVYGVAGGRLDGPSRKIPYGTLRAGDRHTLAFRVAEAPVGAMVIAWLWGRFGDREMMARTLVPMPATGDGRRRAPPEILRDSSGQRIVRSR